MYNHLVLRSKSSSSGLPKPPSFFARINRPLAVLGSIVAIALSIPGEAQAQELDPEDNPGLEDQGSKSFTWTKQEELELAKILTNDGLGTFSCGACIESAFLDLDSDQAKALLNKMTLAIEEHYSDQPDKANQMSFVLNGILEDVDSLDLSNEVPIHTIDPEKLSLKGMFGVYGVLGNSTDLLPVSQVGLNYALDENFSFQLGASLRPDVDIDGQVASSSANLLEAKFQYKSKVGRDFLSAGYSVFVANESFRPNVFEEESLLACGCTGLGVDSDMPSHRDGAFDSLLRETVILGLHTGKGIGEHTFVRVSVGASHQNELHKDMKLIALLAATHRFNDQLQASASVIASSEQVSSDLGAVYQPNSNTKLSVGIGIENGQHDKLSAYFRAERMLFNNPKLAGAFTAAMQNDFDLDHMGFQFRPAVVYRKGNLDYGALLILGRKEVSGVFGVAFGF